MVFSLYSANAMKPSYYKVDDDLKSFKLGCDYDSSDGKRFYAQTVFTDANTNQTLSQFGKNGVMCEELEANKIGKYLVYACVNRKLNTKIAINTVIRNDSGNIVGERSWIIDSSE